VGVGVEMAAPASEQPVSENASKDKPANREISFIFMI
jgi:hypothetical protein